MSELNRCIESFSVMKRKFNGNVHDSMVFIWRAKPPNDYLEYFYDYESASDVMDVIDMPSVFLFRYFRSIKSYIYYLYSSARKNNEQEGKIIGMSFIFFRPGSLEVLSRKEIIFDESVSILNELDIFLRLIKLFCFEYDFKIIDFIVSFNYRFYEILV